MKIRRIIEIEEKDYEAASKVTISLDGAMSIYNAIRESKPYNPSGDLISREDLKKEFKKIYHCADTMEELANTMEDAIDNAPTVDVTALCPVDFPTADDPYPCCSYKRPRGEWIVIHNALGETKYQCNQCQHYVKPSDDKNFCPNCGAQMKIGGDNT